MLPEVFQKTKDFEPAAADDMLGEAISTFFFFLNGRQSFNLLFENLLMLTWAVERQCQFSACCLLGI